MMHDFGENKTEKNKNGTYVEVYKLPKYEESREKAIAIIEAYEEITDGDFWILKNETRNGGIMYSGLIMSHNACLKLNETLEAGKRFRPECITLDKEGYNNSLVYTYCCPEQGIYEVGEVNKDNCKQKYPYAMALKRCFDRVVLKSSKLAFAGIYSESESDTFVRSENPSESKIEAPEGMSELITAGQINILTEMVSKANWNVKSLAEYYGKKSIDELTGAEYGDALNRLKGIRG